MGEVERGGAERRLDRLSVRSQSRTNSVGRLPRIGSADYVIHGVLKIVWDDGYEGVVDLRPTMARGRIFTYLQSPENFRNFHVAEYGHSLGWINEAGEEIDFDSHNLRQKSENQAQLQRLVAAMNY